MFRGGGQILFDNPDFEDDSHCDPADCEETDISCIEGWWNYDATSVQGDFAWFYYDDYFACETLNYSLDPCEGERGIQFALQTGGGQMYPTTSNPFYSKNQFAAYSITFKALVYETNLSNDVIIELYGSNTTTAGSGTLISSSSAFESNSECHEINIGIVNAEDVAELVGFQYIYFKPNYAGLSPSTHTIIGVMDNISVCTLFNVEITTEECGKLCAILSSNCEDVCDEIEYNDPYEDDCFMSVVWGEEVDEELVFYDDCYFPFLGEEVCCFTPPGYRTYFAFIDIKVYVNGVEERHLSTIEVEYMPCTTETITDDITWDANDIDPLTRFELITVESGNTLTIMDDLTLRFCETGKLVINPGGKVILNGVLTSDCIDGWLGVEVQGNGATNQYPSFGLYPQGQLYCNPNSRIENAKTAVKLYGPEYEDAGGMIFAEGADFINNSRGLDFAPFHNYFPTTATQKPFQSKVRDCQFNINNDYNIPWAFIEHIKLNGVFGIGIYGTYFGHERIISEPFSPKQFGIGIKAINSGFTVGATAIDQEEEPCLPPCDEYNRSTFYGLGIGISVGKFLKNRPFQVYNSEFEKCFFGIANEGVSGANILFNDFIMGTTHEIEGDENQVGISLSGYQMLGAVQENSFLVTEGNADFTLGIVSNNLGEMDNKIRKNNFDGLVVGNEAFHRNAEEDKELYNTGLNYLCNTNTNVELFDFTVLLAGQNNFIRHQQGRLDISIPHATGNTFSRTGDIDFRDFANFGERGINYWQYYVDADQVLEDYTDITITPIDIGFITCEPEFCLNPCLDPEDLSSEIGRYYSHLEEYLDVINEDEFEEAVVYLSAIHENLSDISRYMESDTSGFNRDTLRKWYRRYAGVTGELLLAGDYFDAGLSVPAGNTIDSMAIRYSLGADQLLDIMRVRRIYDILTARTVYSLTSTDIDSLNVFAQAYGASYSLARSILPLIDTVFTPRYYIPGELSPRGTNEKEKVTDTEMEIKVFPNPASRIIYVKLPEKFQQRSVFELIDLKGNVIAYFNLQWGVNHITLTDHINLTSTVYMYRIYSEDKMFSSGKLILID